METEDRETGWSDEPFKHRVWEAIEGVRRDQVITQEKFKVVERDFMRQNDYCHMEQSRWEALQEKLAAHDTRLIKIEGMIEHLVETMDAYWKFPLKVLVFIGALGTAGIVMYKWARGISHMRLGE